jgi:hypothetical protein
MDPAHARSRSRRAWFGAVYKLELQAALIDVVGALDERGIHSLLLKGPLFASWLYDAPAERGYRDIDLLIDPKRFEATRDVMAGLGFERQAPPKHARRRADHHEIWLRRGRQSARMELHRTLRLVPVDEAVVWRALEESAVTIEIAGARISAPDEPACALIVALHVAQHGLSMARPRADLERAVARVDHDVWRGAARLARELGAAPAFAAGLAQVPGGSDLARLVGVSAAGVPRLVRLQARTTDAGAKRLGWVVAQLWAPGAGHSRLGLLRSLIVPPRKSMLEGYPFARRGPAWLMLAYLVRPVRIGKTLPSALWTWLRA